MISRWKKSVVNFLKREDGPTAVEYGILLAVIAVVIVGAVLLGNSSGGAYSATGNSIPNTDTTETSNQ